MWGETPILGGMEPAHSYTTPTPAADSAPNVMPTTDAALPATPSTLAAPLRVVETTLATSSATTSSTGTHAATPSVPTTTSSPSTPGVPTFAQESAPPAAQAKLVVPAPIGGNKADSSAPGSSKLS